MECAPLPVDASRCVEHADLLLPVVAQGVVVDARLDHAVLAELALERGSWHARLPAPDGGCEDVVVQFTADEARLGDLAAERHALAEVASPETAARVERVFGEQGAWSFAVAQQAAEVAP